MNDSTKGHPSTGQPGLGKKRKGVSLHFEKNTGSSPTTATATVQLTMENGRTVNIRGVTANQLASAMGGGSMTAEEAAKYVNTYTMPVSNTKASPNGKVSFGPERPPSFPQGNSTNSSTNTSPPMDYASMAAAMAAMGIGKGGSNITGKKSTKGKNKSSNSNNAMPCSEEEMKALMGMFMEMMGLSLGGGGDGSSSSTTSNTSGKGKASTSKSGPCFAFGDGTTANMPDGINAASAAAAFFPDGSSWEALRRTYAAAQQVSANGDHDYDDDDLGEDADNYGNDRELTFEEVEYLLQQRKQKEGRGNATKSDTLFPSEDGESLEQASMEEELLCDEDETKERKAAKKREKKNRRKAKQQEEAAQKAAEVEQKKREKATLSWRSRVISATQTDDITKLEALLKESPLRKVDERESSMHLSNADVTAHFEFLLPNTVPKNRATTDRGAEARMRLATFVLEYDVRLAFEPLRTGRTAFHTACFYGDLQFVTLVLDTVKDYQNEKGKVLVPDEYFNTPCLESGWTPLHYAAVSTSTDVMEALLKRGCDLSVTTEATLTWRKSDGKGVTPRQLVDLVKSGKHEKTIETHGLALQEITNTHFGHHQDRREFLRQLDRIHFRLSGIEKNGYTPPSVKDTAMKEDSVAPESAVASVENSSSTSKKKKKKKKGKTGKDTGSPETIKEEGKTEEAKDASVIMSPGPSVEEDQDDPLVHALMGMGFDKIQIQTAIKACGGSHRATADDVVMKILGQTSESIPEEDVSTNGDTRESDHQVDAQALEDSSRQPTAKPQQSAKAQQQETARKLAEKREQTRRRNREWNIKEQARREEETSAKVVKKAVQQIFAAPPMVSATSLAANTFVPRAVPLRGPVSQAAARYPHVRPPVVPSPSERMPTEMPKTAQWHPSSVQPRAPQMYPTSIPENADVTLQPPGMSGSGSIASNSHPTQYVIYDDDRTVSSFGSNRGLSVNSREFVPTSFTATPPILSSQTPPPGFLPTTAQPVALPMRPHGPVSEQHVSEPDLPNDMQNGEIRATAKAFVPSGFPQTSSLANDFQAQRLGLSQPLGGLPTEPVSSSFHSSMVGAPSISLGNALSTSFDPVPSMTPVSEDSTIPGSSLLRGLATEDPALPIPVSFGGNQSKSTSNFLDASSCSGPIGASSIWGDAGTQGLPSFGSALSTSLFGEDKDVLGSDMPSLWDTGSQKVTQGSIW